METDCKLNVFCFIFCAEILSSYFLMSFDSVNLVEQIWNSNQSELLTPNQTINENDLTTTVPEVSHNSAFLLQHSRFCCLTCSPIGKDDIPEPRRWALQASLMWKREDSMISSWTSDSSCENQLSNTSYDACWPTTSKYCAITELGSGPRKM